MKAKNPSCPAVPLPRGWDSGTRGQKRDNTRNKQRDKTRKARPRAASKTCRRDRQRDKCREILSHLTKF